jgi:peptidoglycan/xylan/chitin deacetylase (PgdA/CDA1 family)
LPALGADLFRAQLEHLRDRYAVVPLRELTQRAAERSPGDPLPVAITFDDDLANHAEVAAPMLTEFGFPATFFLCGRTLDGPSTLWPQDLQAILNNGSSVSEVQQALAKDWPWARLDGKLGDLIQTIEALPPEQRDAVAAKLREQSGSAPIDSGLPTAAVKDMVDAGFEIGFHTFDHYAPQTLDDAQLEGAMNDGLDQLAAVTGYRPTSIAYPHGKADLRVAGAAQVAGFERGFIGAHAAATPEQHPLLTARVVGWTESLDEFAWALARLSSAA